MFNGIVGRTDDETHVRDTQTRQTPSWELWQRFSRPLSTKPQVRSSLVDVIRPVGWVDLCWRWEGTLKGEGRNGVSNIIFSLKNPWWSYWKRKIVSYSVPLLFSANQFMVSVTSGPPRISGVNRRSQEKNSSIEDLCRLRTNIHSSPIYLELYRSLTSSLNAYLTLRIFWF